MRVSRRTQPSTTRELVAFCRGCWHFTDFQHNKGTIAALELLTKFKIDAHKTASGTQGRLRGALTSQEIAKYVEHCLKPGKAPGPDKCPNDLLKEMSDKEFLVFLVVPHCTTSAWQAVLKLAQLKRQDAHDAPSCPLLKFITAEANQGVRDCIYNYKNHSTA